MSPGKNIRQDMNDESKESLFRKRIIYVLGLALIIGTWAVDFLILREKITFTLVYLLPIYFVTWYCGLYYGLSLSLVSFVAWFSIRLTERFLTPDSFITYVNMATKLAIFVLFTFMLSKLKTMLTDEKSLSRTDELTRLANFRAFKEALNKEVERSRRFGHPFSLAYIDIDDFKAVNDTLGHDMGNQVLVETAKAIRSSLRKTDLPARIGGDEFTILFVESDSLSIKEVMKSIHQVLVRMTAEKGWAITFSIGVATFYGFDRTAEEFLGLTDNLMYTIKNTTKNSIIFETYK